MKEIEDAVRTIAKNLGKYSAGKSMHIIVDSDGAFTYEFVKFRVLADPDLAQLELELLLKRRDDVRAKTFGTKEA